MTSRTAIALTCLLTVFSLLLSISKISFGLGYNSGSGLLDFQNSSFLDFSQMSSFAVAPHLGLLNDSSLVAYWNVDNDLGGIVADVSGNSNNGVVKGAKWVDGKYGKALSFAANDSVTVAAASSLNISDYVTLAAWIFPKSVGQNGAGRIVTKNDPFDYGLSMDTDGSVCFVTNARFYAKSGPITLNHWHYVAATFNKDLNSNQVKVYVDGVLKAESSVQSITAKNTEVYIGNRYDNVVAFDGLIDDVYIYSRVLSDREIALSFMLPDPASLSQYYALDESVSNNTLLVHVDNPNKYSNDTVVVTCAGSFVTRELSFKANNSAIVNVWTTLGQPFLTMGSWNSQNSTTTLALDAFSVAKLNWNTFDITTYTDAHSSVTPSNITVVYGATQTLNFSAAQGYRLNVTVDGIPQGQISNYTFNKVTATHTVNVTASLLTFRLTVLTDVHSIVTPGNVSVNYDENQLFNVAANSGYRVSHVYIDGADMGNISAYNFEKVQSNHTISVSSATLNESTSSKPSTDPTKTSTPPQNNQFPTETVAIMTAITAIIAALAIAFRKGYITIEVIEENIDGNPSQESPESQQTNRKKR